MVRPFFHDVRRIRSDVSRDDVRHALADAWASLSEISTSLAEAPKTESSVVGQAPAEPGWGKLAELAGTLEMSSRTLRVLLVRRGIDAARKSSTWRIENGRTSVIDARTVKSRDDSAENGLKGRGGNDGNGT